MDVLPDDSAEELVPVGFAEGRCDVFRVEALRSVGFYDTHLRVSGEDQVLAAKLRRAGWEIWQAPRLVYYLSVSGEQDSVTKLVRHQRLFGRTDPYILFAVPGSHDGLLGGRAGANRRRRALLRGSQVGATAAVPAHRSRRSPSAAGSGWRRSRWPLVALARVVLYRRHAAAVRLGAAGGAEARSRAAAARPGVHRGAGRGLLVPRARRALGPDRLVGRRRSPGRSPKPTFSLTKYSGRFLLSS